jgi:hypothetical protein
MDDAIELINKVIQKTAINIHENTEINKGFLPLIQEINNRKKISCITV